MKAVDLFSGCGGLSEGLLRAGFTVVGAVEVEPLAAETYRMNHKKTRVWETDIRNLDPARMMTELNLKSGELDLLAGCPPCQGFSSMRTLNGGKDIKDPINDLVFEFLRFVETFLPKALMMENVPGLATDRRFHRLAKKLQALGYSINWDIVDVADYGVPQRRRRFILIGGFQQSISIVPGNGRVRTVRQAIGSLPKPGVSGDPLHDLPENRASKIQEMISLIPKNGGGRKDLPTKFKLACHKRCDGFRDVYGRMWWDRVAPTITGGCVNPSKGRFLHPDQNRSITLREAAMLQSFPKRYKFSLRKGKFPAAQMIGNALPPKFIRIQASGIMKALL